MSCASSVFSQQHEKALQVARHVSECCPTTSSSDMKCGAFPFFALFRLRWASSSSTSSSTCLNLEHNNLAQPQQGEVSSAAAANPTTTSAALVLDEVIGEWRDFSEELLARRYRSLALLLHPDRWVAAVREQQQQQQQQQSSGKEELVPSGDSDHNASCYDTTAVTPAAEHSSSETTPPIDDFVQRCVTAAATPTTIHHDALRGAFSSMQSAYHTLRNAETRARYISQGHDAFCAGELDPTLQHRRQQALAHLMAATMFMFRGNSGDNNTDSEATTTGAKILPQQDPPPPPPPHHLTALCAASPPSPTCTRYVFMEGSICDACRRAQLLAATKKPLASQSSRCSTFGCLRVLTSAAEDVESGCCSYCRNRPKKCSALGCFTMVTAAQAATLAVSLSAKDTKVWCCKHFPK